LHAYVLCIVQPQHSAKTRNGEISASSIYFLFHYATNMVFEDEYIALGSVVTWLWLFHF